MGPCPLPDHHSLKPVVHSHLEILIFRSVPFSSVFSGMWNRTRVPFLYSLRRRTNARIRGDPWYSCGSLYIPKSCIRPLLSAFLVYPEILLFSSNLCSISRLIHNLIY